MEFDDEEIYDGDTDGDADANQFDYVEENEGIFQSLITASLF